MLLVTFVFALMSIYYYQYRDVSSDDDWEEIESADSDHAHDDEECFEELDLTSSRRSRTASKWSEEIIAEQARVTEEAWNRKF